MKKRLKISKHKKKLLHKKHKHKINFYLPETENISFQGADKTVQPQIPQIPAMKIPFLEEKRPPIEEKSKTKIKQFQNLEQKPFSNVSGVANQEKPKHKISIKTIIFEIFFWSGLLLTIYGILTKLKSLLLPIIGIGLMILGLLLFAIPSKKQRAAKKEEQQKIPIEKKLPETKTKPGTQKESPSLTQLEPIKPIKKDIKSQKSATQARISVKAELAPEEVLASKEAKKNLTKKFITTIAIIVVMGTLLIVLNKFNLLRNIYGISVIVIVLAIILIALIQNKRKYKQKTKMGIVSNPSPEIEVAIKKLNPDETEIDLFLDYIKNKKSVLITTIAREFGFSIEKVEEFAKILEKNDLIKIYYPVFGPPSLKYLEKIKKEENNAKQDY